MKIRFRHAKADNIPVKMISTRQKVLRYKIIIAGLTTSNLISLGYLYFNNLQ